MTREAENLRYMIEYHEYRQNGKSAAYYRRELKRHLKSVIAAAQENL